MARPNLRRISHIQRPEPDFSFIPGPSLSHPLSNPSPRRPLIQLSQGWTLSQHHNLPVNLNNSLQLADPAQEPLNQGDNCIDNIDYSINDAVPDTQDSQNRRKKVKQANTWLQRTIPSLIQPYIKWVHTSANMQDSVQIPTTQECTCRQPGLQVKVRVVHWEGRLSCFCCYAVWLRH